MRQEHKNYKHNFSQEDLAEFAEKIAGAEEAIVGLQSDIAEAKEDIKTEKGLITECLTLRRNGYEIRSKLFNVILDEEKRLIRYQDPETKEILEELDEDMDGYQAQIEDQTPYAGGAEPEQEEEEEEGEGS